ncbi:MAG: hypothetical protein LQ343_003623 [Gyalolechia ehrenbergii]|nr:MAG: hypothetical protein LQ343_003623 [Gyalolechia ehrenbergii]
MATTTLPNSPETSFTHVTMPVTQPLSTSMSSPTAASSGDGRPPRRQAATKALQNFSAFVSLTDDLKRPRSRYSEPNTTDTTTARKVVLRDIESDSDDDVFVDDGDDEAEGGALGLVRKRGPMKRRRKVRRLKKGMGRRGKDDSKLRRGGDGKVGGDVVAVEEEDGLPYARPVEKAAGRSAGEGSGEQELVEIDLTAA